MTLSEFWRRRLYKFDSALFRDYVCAQGCIAAAFGFGHECSNDISAHHCIKVSQGGSSIYCIGCCLTHHSEADINTTKFLLRIGVRDQSELHQRYIEGFLETIGACEGEIILPKAQRKAKKSTRKNRQKFNYYERPY